MVVDESARHALHQRLDATLGREEAATLMSMLPTDSIATKRDVDALGYELRTEIRTGLSDLRNELVSANTNLASEVHKDFREYTRLMFFSMIMTMIMLAGLAFGAAQLS